MNTPRTLAPSDASTHRAAGRFRELAERYVRTHAATEQAARAVLVRLGTHLPNGSLAPEYER